MTRKPELEYSHDETVRRRDATLLHMLKTPPKPHSKMKLGKPRGKKSKRPVAGKAKPQAKPAG